MRINVVGDRTVSLKALVALQVVLIVAAGVFVAFLYGRMGPLLAQRKELQDGVAALRDEIGTLQEMRKSLFADKGALEKDRNSLREEIARLSADRAVLSASMRTLSAGTDRAVAAVEGAAAASKNPAPLSPRVYIHVASEPSAERARALLNELEQAGFIVPSVQRVKASPSRPQLRVFASGDREVANRAFEIARRVIPGLELRSFVGRDIPTGAAPALRPGHLELWF